MNEWISCSTRLPEEGEFVLFFSPMPTGRPDTLDVWFGCMHLDADGCPVWRGVDCVDNGEPVTHWMPLPAAPGSER